MHLLKREYNLYQHYHYYFGLFYINFSIQKYFQNGNNIPQYYKEEFKQNNNNINNTYNNIYINKTNNNIIYNKEDFNNNDFYQNEKELKINKNKGEINKISLEIKKNKNILNYNNHYISPKKNSKILLKSIYCSPVSVKYTEIKDAELLTRKQQDYIEQTEEKEETELTIKNKILKIWDNINECINENNFSYINEANNEKDYLMEKYKQKIEELQETISILMTEKENKIEVTNDIINWNDLIKIQNIHNMILSPDKINKKNKNQLLDVINIFIFLEKRKKNLLLIHFLAKNYAFQLKKRKRYI